MEEDEPESRLPGYLSFEFIRPHRYTRTELEATPGEPTKRTLDRKEVLERYAQKYSRMSWLNFLCDTEGYQLFKQLKGNGLLEKAKALNCRKWEADRSGVYVLA